MTFILNVLHSDMSVVAADQKAIAEWPPAASQDKSGQAGTGSIVYDYKKIQLSLGGSLALGIAGQTQDHYYLPSIGMSASIDEALWKIRKHMEGFLRIGDRSTMAKSASFPVNQGIATFFDQDAGMYFSNTYLFTPMCNETRLHRGTDETKIFYAGSGSEFFADAVGFEDIEGIKSFTNKSRTPEACISWIRDAYKKVSARDVGTGSDAVIMVSTRSSPRFCSVESR